MNHEDRPSKTQLKRDADALQAIGERLLTLPEHELATLPLPDALLEAVRTGRRLDQRGARRRQRQYIGKLMRGFDTTELQTALAAMDNRENARNRLFHEAEQWRDRFLADGMPALETFFDHYPQADRQRLRQLVLAARKEAAADRAPTKRRELFRETRQLLENLEAAEQTGKMPG